MKHGILTIDDFDVRGKTVLLRVDINQPVDKEKNTLKDTTRIKRCAPTISELSGKGAKIVLLAHQGSDIEYKNYHDLSPHGKVLGEILGKQVRYIQDVCGPYARECIKELVDGDILLLDNVRFMAEEMTLFETKLNLSPRQMAKTQVVKKLAPLSDIYVCDAFAAAHRSQPSLVGFQQVLPSAMGRLFEKEYTVLSDMLEAPAKPLVFVLGGAKIQDAFLMMEKVLADGIADKVLAGGLLGNVMLIADGIDIGAPSTEFIIDSNLGEFIEKSKELLERFGDRIVLPVDLAHAGEGRATVDVCNLPADALFMDIGEKTAEIFRREIMAARTVFVNGPVGVFEKPLTDCGTKLVWQALAETDGYTVLGGGDSIAATNKYGLESKMDYLCTGGGAMVRFLSGEELPVIEALKYATKRKW